METGRLRQEVVEQSRQAATSNIVTTEVTRLREEVVQLRGHNVSGTEASQYYSRTEVSAAVHAVQVAEGHIDRLERQVADKLEQQHMLELRCKEAKRVAERFRIAGSSGIEQRCSGERFNLRNELGLVTKEKEQAKAKAQENIEEWRLLENQRRAQGRVELAITGSRHQNQRTDRHKRNSAYTVRGGVGQRRNTGGNGEGGVECSKR